MCLRVFEGSNVIVYVFYNTTNMRILQVDFSKISEKKAVFQNMEKGKSCILQPFPFVLFKD